MKPQEQQLPSFQNPMHMGRMAHTGLELGSVVSPRFQGAPRVPVLIVWAAGEDIAQHPWAMSPLPDVTDEWRTLGVKS